MYKVNLSKNDIENLDEKSFSELGFHERSHLQEWIRKTPFCLGEELLIIQKEFDGFNDTQERLDLLALDKQGNLVIIENKLDDSGRDTVWQSLKYASYCSTLTSDDILNIFSDYLKNEKRNEGAEDVLKDFFQDEDYIEKLNVGNSQRIILVSGSFRKEVTSTVLWLLNFGLRVQCFKSTAYSLEKEVFLNFEQIIPIKDAEEFVISIAKKTQKDLTNQKQIKNRENIRFRFWTKYLNYAEHASNLFDNVSPSTDAWIGAGVGISGIGLNLVVTRSSARAEIYINRGSKENNKAIFDYFNKYKTEIEKSFGETLIWERMDENVTSRIKTELSGVSLYDEEDWDKMIQYLSRVTYNMELAFKDPIKKLKVNLRK